MKKKILDIIAITIVLIILSPALIVISPILILTWALDRATEIWSE